ncbi:MAG: MFS transporter, partial [Planctomycetota bacterium]
MTDAVPAARPASSRGYVFAVCFIALVATSFAFIIRAFIINDWAGEFDLSETQKGELFGAGLWPFAISIIVFSLIIDRIGYGVALWFAFACHVVSAIITINARGYGDLYLGNFICALGNGTVEAVINPVIAAMFWQQKTKWLNILHAGWPGGLVVGGLLTLGMEPGNLFGSMGGATLADPIDWRWQVGLLLIPAVLYGVMLIFARFPVSERVAAGVSYRAMLAEFGAVGMLIAAWLIFVELGRVWGWPGALTYALIGVTVVGFGIASRSLGRPLFVFLLLVMILLATTELGTDAWIKELMTPVMMDAFSIDGGWVLIYTASIMIVLRVFCGPFVKLFNPLGLLVLSSLFAAVGIAFLSTAAGVVILVAATIYGIGQTFFWPTTLGLVAERFPKGGALTLNAIAGVGMLGVGILGAPLLGNIQDRHISAVVQAEQPDLAPRVLAEEPKRSVIGSYRPLDADMLAELDADEQQTVQAVQAGAKKSALLQVA